MARAILKKKCLDFYKNEGWNIDRNKQINSFSIKFDILKNGNNLKAFYLLNNTNKIELFVSIAKAMESFKKKYELILLIPPNLKITSNEIITLGEAGIEVVTLKSSTVTTIISPEIRRNINKEKINKIKKILTDINLISGTNSQIGFKLINIDERDKVISNIKIKITKDDEYLKQILNLSLILDKINVEEIKKKFTPTTLDIKKGAIYLLESSLIKTGLNIDKGVFSIFRKIRKLRTEYPVHLKKSKKELKEITIIKKEFTGDLQPREVYLWECVTQKFLWAIETLRMNMRG